MLKTLRKNPINKNDFSLTYKSFLKQWGKSEAYTEMFQNSLLQSISSDTTYIFGDYDLFIQVIKIVCYISEYKKGIWVISDKHNEQIKQATLEMDVDKINILYGMCYLHALSTTFEKDMIVLCYECPWEIIRDLSDAKMVVVSSVAHKLSDNFIGEKNDPIVEWIGSNEKNDTKYLEEMAKKAINLELINRKESQQLLLPHIIESNKLKYYQEKLGADTSLFSVRIKPIGKTDYILDSGRTMVREYHYKSRSYRLQKRFISQNMLWDRQHHCKQKYFLFLAPSTELPDVEIISKPITMEILQLLVIKSPSTVRKIMSKYYLPDFVDMSMKTLYYLEAIDSRGRLTLLGEKMQVFATDPQIARMIVKHGNKCHSIFYLAAALHIAGDLREWFLGDSCKHGKWIDVEGDHTSLLKLIIAFVNVKDTNKTSWCLQNGVNEKLLRNTCSLASQFAEEMDIILKPENVSLEGVINAVMDGFFLQTIYKTDTGLHIVGYKKPLLKLNQIPKKFPAMSVCSCITIIKNEKLLVTSTPVTATKLYAIAPKYFIKKR
tara:strand:+ start:4531 stop:6174 length:1644 start_codon:yes stop_codon:yes gene_type:complete